MSEVRLFEPDYEALMRELRGYAEDVIDGGVSGDTHGFANYRRIVQLSQMRIQL